MSLSEAKSPSDALQKKDKIKKRIYLLECLREKFPERWALEKRLAWTYKSDGRFDEAVGILLASHTKRLSEKNAILGWLYFGENKYNEAKTYFDASWSADSKNAGALQGLIASYRKLGNFKEAELRSNEARQQFPKSLGIDKEKGWIYLERLDYARAVDFFQALAKVRPEDSSAYYWLVEALTKTRRFEEAVQWLDTARQNVKWDHELTLQEGKLLFARGAKIEAIRKYDQILDKSPNHIGSIQAKLAALRLSERIDEAEELLRSVPPELEKDLGVKLEEALLARERKEIDRAVQILKEIASSPACNVADKLNLAEVLCEQDDDTALRQAEEICRKVLASVPNNSRAYGCLGTVCLRGERFNEAEIYLRRSIDFDPNSEYYAILASMYNSLYRFSEAAKIIDKGFRVNSSNSALSVQRGNLLNHLGRHEQAVSAFRAAVRLDGRSFNAQMGLADALMKTGRSDEAEAILVRFSREAIGDARTKLSHALISLLFKKFEETKEPSYLDRIQSEIQKRRPDITAEDMFYEGIVFAKVGKFRDAERSFNESFKKDNKLLVAQANASKVRLHIGQENKSMSGAALKSWIVAGAIMLQILVLWYLILFTTGDHSAAFVLLPICFGLMIAAFLLPYLNKLSVTGLEVQIDSASQKISANVPLDALAIGREIRVELPAESHARY